MPSSSATFGDPRPAGPGAYPARTQTTVVTPAVASGGQHGHGSRPASMPTTATIGARRRRTPRRGSGESASAPAALCAPSTMQQRPVAEHLEATRARRPGPSPPRPPRARAAHRRRPRPRPAATPRSRPGGDRAAARARPRSSHPGSTGRPAGRRRRAVLARSRSPGPSPRAPAAPTSSHRRSDDRRPRSRGRSPTTTRLPAR